MVCSFSKYSSTPGRRQGSTATTGSTPLGPACAAEEQNRGLKQRPRPQTLGRAQALPHRRRGAWAATHLLRLLTWSFPLLSASW